MRGIHTRVIDVHQHIGAAQAEVVVRGDRVHGDADALPAEIVGRRSQQRPFDLLNSGQPGDGGQTVRRRQHSQHRPKRGGLFIPHDAGAQRLQIRAGRLARIREEQHVETAVAGQRILRHRQFQQRKLELVIRLIGQNGLHLRGSLQLPRHRR